MIAKELIEKGRLAKEAAYHLTLASSEQKNGALEKIAVKLLERKDEIIKANELDINDAKDKNMPVSLQDRLLLTSKRIEDMAEGLKQLISLPDPIGEIERMWKTTEGLEIGKMRVPLGVIGIIYEARPNVTVDAAGLCLKSGNAVILRGGSDAINSNKKIAQIIEEAISDSELPAKSVQLIEDTSREVANQMLKLNEYLDVLIPRGGAGLIKNVVENATVPVIETGTGNCHLYVEQDANLEMAKNIVINAKTQRTGVCNAAESLLIHESIASSFLNLVGPELINLGVEIRGCEKCKQILSNSIIATEKDYATEFLDLIIAVKIVKDIDEALNHIRKFGTKHSEAIITNSYSKAKKFQRSVDAAAVYVNASTRFTDGFMFGFGAEIGISTQKLHARGPMGLKELTSFKYIINGEGQIRK
ncbi:glutamate-5-semialdehyde dehydrogenase [Desulfonispora thiosulfatigenes DSM 11270]|uniref:Gamma-glutamyl phosphate reductase n=1 Tax=Desulfonispora thiosulfatigenes DSM 11270 TaxID=656914 RepID=A0A1W1UGZ6_DESTI|nr:glutamate-5-semialdehyde dehydrogenase [Desulfonispora thiosulfatigenes]SMB80309.1 glutamate-5-semialdehyde dehydrogenase [Desulfonispora thiosulfatigenes DSM 11270]